MSGVLGGVFVLQVGSQFAKVGTKSIII